MSTGKAKAKNVKSGKGNGKLHLDLVGLPLPRSRGWSYSVTLCGNELFRAGSYAQLLREHPVTSEVDFAPGEHVLRIRGSKAKNPPWEVEVRAMAPEGQRFYDIRTVLLRDRLPPVRPSGRGASSRMVSSYKIVRRTGLVEVANQVGGVRGQIRAVSARKGMTLRPGGVLVTGPGSSAVVDQGAGPNAPRSVIKELSIMPLGFSRLGQPGTKEPMLAFNRGKVVGKSPTCGHCVACSVRG